MKQNDTDTENLAMTFVKLADEAWKNLGSRPLVELSLTDIAHQAGVDFALANAVSGDVKQLILGKMAALDDKSIMDSFNDIKDAGEITIHEKILEALMHRFEIYAPYRTQISALKRAACGRPDLSIALGMNLQTVTRRMLIMAGDSCRGLRGILRVKGVIGVVLVVSQVWMKDNSQDLAPTMKELDRRLQQAEEWGVSLKLFKSEKNYQADAHDSA